MSERCESNMSAAFKRGWIAHLSGGGPLLWPLLVIVWEPLGRGLRFYYLGPLEDSGLSHSLIIDLLSSFKAKHNLQPTANMSQDKAKKRFQNEIKK